MTEISIIIYAIAGAISAVVLSRWLHMHKHKELGETWLTEIAFGIMFALFWPVTVPMMINNS